MLTLYSKANCPECVKLKSAMNIEEIPYEEIRVDLIPDARQFLIDAGHRSVPQVYQDGVHVPMERLYFLYE